MIAVDVVDVALVVGSVGGVAVAAPRVAVIVVFECSIGCLVGVDVVTAVDPSLSFRLMSMALMKLLLSLLLWLWPLPEWP